MVFKHLTAVKRAYSYIFIHKDDRMVVAQGQFTDKEGEGDLT